MKHMPFLTLKPKFQLSRPCAALVIAGVACAATADCSSAYLCRIGPVPLSYEQQDRVPSFAESALWIAGQTASNTVAQPAETNLLTAALNASIGQDSKAAAPSDQAPEGPSTYATPALSVLQTPQAEPELAPLPPPEPLITAQMLVPLFTSSASNSAAVLVVPTFVPPLPPSAHSSTATYRVQPP